MATDEVGEFLTQTARLAAATVVPGGHLSCGITLRRGDRHPFTVASSDARAHNVDEVQYTVDHGLCLHALRTGDLVVIDDLATDPTWEPYRQRGLAAGVGSLLAVPIAVEGVRAAMNLYTSKPHAFDLQAIEQAAAVAEDASAAITLAVRIAGHVELAGQLRTALVSRTVIDQAIGIIIAKNRCTAQAAFEVLSHASQHRNIKLRDLAAQMVADAESGPGPR